MASTIPSVLLQLEKPGVPILSIVKGDTAVFVFTYMQDAGPLIPSGSINGGSGVGNVTFTLPSAVVAGTLKLWLGGVLQTENVEYSLSGVTITFLNAPQLGTSLLASYSTPIDITGLTSTWDIRTSPTATPVLTGTGTVGGSNGVITVSVSASSTASLTPTGTGNNSNTFAGTLTLKVLDTNSNVKTLEKAQINLVL
jgi:hypothetical protein